MNKFILLLVLISLFSPLEAQIGRDTTLPSTEWQKAALEKDVYSRLERRLDTIIKNKQYLIDVTITTSVPQKPDFNLGGGRPPKNIKFSNETPDKNSGDYIVFSKFGLEVPAISALEEAAQTQQKSELEYLWKYNQSVDVFKNLEEVKITLSLSEKIKEDLRGKVKELIEAIDLGLGDIRPAYTYKYINFEIIPEKIAEPVKPELPKEKSVLEKLEQFSNAIGLLLATLLLGIIALVLMKKYENLKKGEQKGQATPPAPMMMPEKEKEEEKERSAVTQSGGTQGDNDLIYTNGFERFTDYLEKNPEGAYYLVRKWIKSEGEKEKKALYALVKVLDNKTLVNVFENISFKDREAWKTILQDKEAFVSDVKEIDPYISRQVVEEVIVPYAINDNELLEMLMDISDENAAHFIKQDISLGAYLIELLSSRHVGKIFKHLDSELIKSTLKFTSQIKKSAIAEKAQELKAALAPFTSKATDDSFVRKICELIPISPASKDEALYEALKEANAITVIAKLARTYYPSFLIKTLPTQIISGLLGTYPTQKKAQLIFSLDTKSREYFFSCLGDDGSAMKEMVKLEIENIETTEKLSKEIKDNSDQIWDEFVCHARKLITPAFGAQPDYHKNITVWFEQGAAAVLDFPEKNDLPLKQGA